MDNAGYVALTRQAGLLQEMQVVATNIANMSTTGYRREGVAFAEFIRDLGPDHSSVSMAAARSGITSPIQGGLSRTGSAFDFAIEGEGFFMLATPSGNMLTRAGSFVLSPEGEVVALDGAQLLDAGGTPVVVPPLARSVSVASDGTMSADGVPVGQIGLWRPADPLDLDRRAGTRFATDAAPLPAEEGAGHILQGFVELSNVNPVAEITRMIEVQRAYELGQGLLDREDERIRSVIRTFAR